MTTAARQSARVMRWSRSCGRIKPERSIVPAGRLSPGRYGSQQLGMIRPGQRWEDMLGAAAIIILSAILVPLYFYRRKRSAVVNDPRSMLVIAIILLCFGWCAFIYQPHLAP
ncbi:MAG: hypothetical protein IPN96_05275 [Anaerolineales bacterium]|nr:hypothetical protein [Anaerolineales bacterium]